MHGSVNRGFAAGTFCIHYERAYFDSNADRRAQLTVTINDRQNYPLLISLRFLDSVCDLFIHTQQPGALSVITWLLAEMRSSPDITDHSDRKSG